MSNGLIIFYNNFLNFTQSNEDLKRWFLTFFDFKAPITAIKGKYDFSLHYDFFYRAIFCFNTCFNVNT